MGEVKAAADARQDELLRRLTLYCPSGGRVCEFQALTARLRKLKKTLTKADEYVAHLQGRVNFLGRQIENGSYLHMTEMLSRRHSNYSDEEDHFLERVAELSEEVAQIEVLQSLCVACGRCPACKPRTPLRRTRSWRTKRMS